MGSKEFLKLIGREGFLQVLAEKLNSQAFFERLSEKCLRRQIPGVDQKFGFYNFDKLPELILPDIQQGYLHTWKKMIPVLDSRAVFPVEFFDTIHAAKLPLGFTIVFNRGTAYFELAHSHVIYSANDKAETDCDLLERQLELYFPSLGLADAPTFDTPQVIHTLCCWPKLAYEFIKPPKEFSVSPYSRALCLAQECSTH